MVRYDKPLRDEKYKISHVIFYEFAWSFPRLTKVSLHITAACGEATSTARVGVWHYYGNIHGILRLRDLHSRSPQAIAQHLHNSECSQELTGSVGSGAFALEGASGAQDVHYVCAAERYAHPLLYVFDLLSALPEDRRERQVIQSFAE